MIWFSSDLHFSHANIIRYANRPYKDTDHMDEEIIRIWNEHVSPDDTVFHLGDVALGPIAKSLPKVSRLNGDKWLILGNHDRPFMRAGKADEEKWWDAYREVFQHVIHWDGMLVDVGGETFKVSHFPYSGDSQDEDRYAECRPHDIGTPLIHGHTHSEYAKMGQDARVSRSARGSLQIHVGWDAWYRPVSEDDIMNLFVREGA